MTLQIVIFTIRMLYIRRQVQLPTAQIIAVDVSIILSGTQNVFMPQTVKRIGSLSPVRTRESTSNGQSAVCSNKKKKQKKNARVLARSRCVLGVV